MNNMNKYIKPYIIVTNTRYNRIIDGWGFRL